jgi:hypothetical protein
VTDQNEQYSKPALNGPFIKWKYVLNGNIFSSRDFRAEKDVKRKLSNAEMEISLYTKNFQSSGMHRFEEF